MIPSKMPSRIQLIGLFVGTMMLVTAPARGAEIAPGSSTPTGQPAGKPCKPFRPNQPPASTKPSYVLPKIERPTVKVTTWGRQITWRPIQRQTSAPTYYRDPYSVQMTGYNEGTKADLYIQNKSEKVQLPESCPGCAEAPSKRMKNPRKWAKKQRSKAWRAAVAKALNYEKLETFTITVPSHKQTQTEQRGNVLPAHTPVKVTARGSFGRKYATVHGHAQGLPTRNAGQTTRNQQVYGRNYTQYGDVSESGLHLPAFDVKANINTDNIYITPAYQKGERVQSKVLGLAAFPAGAQITVTNLRMQGAGEADHTVSFRASRSGSGSIAVPGLQNDKLQVQVSFPQLQNAAQGASHAFNVRIPRASGRPAIKARGIKYYAATLAN